MASLEKKKRKKTKIGCIFLYIIAVRSSEVVEMVWVLFEYKYHIILIKKHKLVFNNNSINNTNDKLSTTEAEIKLLIRQKRD